jgi:hypothetical protein
LLFSLLFSACGGGTNEAASSISPSPKEQLLSTPWKLLDIREDQLLIFAVPQGACKPFDHMEVDESHEQEIRVAALVKEKKPLDEGGSPLGCPLGLEFIYPTYELKHLLGARKLVHAAVSPEERAYEKLVNRHKPTQSPSSYGTS